MESAKGGELRDFHPSAASKPSLHLEIETPKKDSRIKFAQSSAGGLIGLFLPLFLGHAACVALLCHLASFC